MIWVFDRDGEQLKYEITREERGDGFLLVMTEADGKQNVEQVAQPGELIEKSVLQMKKLREDGWKVG
jgi:hypothetical protein